MSSGMTDPKNHIVIDFFVDTKLVDVAGKDQPVEVVVPDRVVWAHNGLSSEKRFDAKFFAMRMAQLLEDAAACGYNMTVTNVPNKPLAMGNYHSNILIRRSHEVVRNPQPVVE